MKLFYLSRLIFLWSNESLNEKIILFSREIEEEKKKGERKGNNSRRVQLFSRNWEACPRFVYRYLFTALSYWSHVVNSLVISEPLPFSLPHDIPLPITQPPSNPLTLCTHSHTVERVCQGWQRHDGGRFFGPLRKKNNYSCFHASDWKLFSPDYFYHPSFLHLPIFFFL